jgi:hypothetical protein
MWDYFNTIGEHDSFVTEVDMVIQQTFQEMGKDHKLQAK